MSTSEGPYDIADEVTIRGGFYRKNANGTKTFVDPTTIVLRIKPPTGSVVVKTYPEAGTVKEAIGKYAYRFVVDKPGRWVYRWEGTGTIPQAEEGEFLVRKSGVLP